MEATTMSHFNARAVVSISAALLVLAAAVPAPAQTVPDIIYRYTVLWTCGKSNAFTSHQATVGADYATSINVLNPSGQTVTVHEQNRFAFTAKTEVPTGATVAWELSPGEAVIVDCLQIRLRFPDPLWPSNICTQTAPGAPPVCLTKYEFRTGFVILDSPVELDVASLNVNNWDNPRKGQFIDWKGGSLDIEYHQPRILHPDQKPVEPVTLQLEALSRFVGDIRDALLRSIGGTE